MKRRNFIKKAALTSLSAVVGTEIVFGNFIPSGYKLLALQDPDPFEMFDKSEEMVVLNDKPWNIEAKAHLLDEKVKPLFPLASFFVFSSMSISSFGLLES